VQLNAGGVPDYLGEPVILLVTDVEFSIKVFDQLGAQVYFQENCKPYEFDAAVLANESITTDKLEDGSVTLPKLADESVSTDKLVKTVGSEAVTTETIRDLAVTTAKIADTSITEDKIVDGAVTPTKIADYSITRKKLSYAPLNYKEGLWCEPIRTDPLQQTFRVEAGDIVTLPDPVTSAQYFIELPYNIDKSITDTFTVGQIGGRSAASALTANTWYRVYLTGNAGDDRVDVIAALNLTEALSDPNWIAGDFTTIRRIGYVFVDGNFKLTPFTRGWDSNSYIWVNPIYSGRQERLFTYNTIQYQYYPSWSPYAQQSRISFRGGDRSGRNDEVIGGISYSIYQPLDTSYRNILLRRANSDTSVITDPMTISGGLGAGDVGSFGFTAFNVGEVELNYDCIGWRNDLEVFD
jgi:hypothetical protein